MEFTANHIESIYNKSKAYAETSIELFKLTAVDKTADILSSLLTRFVLIAFSATFVFFISIGLSLYIGQLLDAYYLGFVITSSLYFITGVSIYFFNKTLIKNPMTSFIIKKLVSKKKDEDTIIKKLVTDEK